MQDCTFSSAKKKEAEMTRLGFPDPVHFSPASAGAIPTCFLASTAILGARVMYQFYSFINLYFQNFLKYTCNIFKIK